MRATTAPIIHIHGRIPANRRLDDGAPCPTVVAARAGLRRPAGLALRATLEPRDRRPFGFAAAAAGGVAAGLADAPPCATPRSRGGGAVEMLASRNPASVSLSFGIWPSSCTVLLRC